MGRTETPWIPDLRRTPTEPHYCFRNRHPRTNNPPRGGAERGGLRSGQLYGVAVPVDRPRVASRIGKFASVGT